MNSVAQRPELTDDAPVGSAIGKISKNRTPTQIPSYRYISKDWAELETKKLWPHVWQLACTTSHLQEPGDFYEYRVGNLSIIVLRDSAGQLRAFQNVCRHRGNILCSGTGAGLTQIRCPYHRWTWTLEGQLREVPSRKGFGKLKNEDYPLFEAAVDTWGPLVFVNPNPDCEPLAKWLEVIPQISSWAILEEFACNYEITIEMPCNWKTLIEAFSETYHLQGIHREMLQSCDDVNSVNRLYGRHGSLYQPYGIPSPRIGGAVSNEEIWESLIVTQGGRYGVESANGNLPACPPVGEGQTIRDALEQLLRSNAEGKDLKVERFSQSQLLDLFQFNFFPNITVIIMFDSVTILRARPGTTPDDCKMDVLNLQRQPNGNTAGIRPQSIDMPVDSASLNLVFDQDISNLRNAQLGLHQPGLDTLVLSKEEMRIINLHHNLEEYLGISPSEIRGGTEDEIQELRDLGKKEMEPTGLNPPW